MKNTNIKQLLRAGVAVMALFVIAIALPSQAAAANSQVTGSDAEHCVVNDPSWNFHASGPNSLTLRKALEYARRNEACTESITLDVDVKASGPMIIESTQLIEGAGYSVNFETWDGGKDDCAVKIMTDGTIIQNLTLSNIEGTGTDSEDTTSTDADVDPTDTIMAELFEATVGPHGICMTEMDAHLINVTISGVDGDAFVFGEGTSGNKVHASSSASGVRGYGVRDMSSSNAALNTVEMTDGTMDIIVMNNGIIRNITDYVDANNNDTRDAGEVDASMFKITSLVERGLMATARDNALKVTYSMLSGGSADTGTFWIQGALVKDASTTLESDGSLDCADSYDVEDTMTRIAIFKYVQGMPTTIQFVAMVGSESAWGVLRGKEGRFSIKINKMDPDHPEFADMSEIILVPLNNEMQIVGNASKRISLTSSGGQTECSDGENYDQMTGTGSGGGANLGGGLLGELVRGFGGYSGCVNWTQHYPTDIPESWDSDFDQVPDFVEMGIRKETDLDGSVKWIFQPKAISCVDTPETALSSWIRPDSDGDGVLDKYELGVLADATKMVEVWKGARSNGCMTDADGDTPEDEKECPAGIYRINPNDVQDPRFDVTDAVPDANHESLTKKILPDVRDPDSDGDGLDDGEESRSDAFLPEAQGYFIRLDGSEYKDAANKNVPCYWSDFEGSDAAGSAPPKMIGNAYGLFITGGVADADGITTIIQPFNKSLAYESSYFETLGVGSNYQLEALACRNITVNTTTDFNGTVDASQESNPYDADTDDDCVCDGDSIGCQELDFAYDADTNPQGHNCLVRNDEYGHNDIPIEMNQVDWYNDNCPRQPHPNNGVGCVVECKRREFSIKMAYNRNAKEWMDIECAVWSEDQLTCLHVQDAKLKGLYDPAGPELFYKATKMVDGVEVIDTEFIKIFCGDADDDGIPNCVELPDDLTCPGPGSDDSLHPYRADTDGDGLIDGRSDKGISDVCPFTPAQNGQNDEYTAVNPNYSCDFPETVYDGNVHGGIYPILAYYLDRDQDGLSDAEEDKNLDGVPNFQDGLAARLTTESDPLDHDTDDDGVGDYIEVRRWKTNPFDVDTDDDGLSDPRERAKCRNPGAVCSQQDYEDLNVTLNSSWGSCGDVDNTTFDKGDTDPLKADTDGDGLNDGLELAGEAANVNEIKYAQDLADLGIAVFLSIQANRSVVSDPTAADSDGDKVCDGPGVDNECGYLNTDPTLSSRVVDAVRDTDGKIIYETMAAKMDYDSSNPCSQDTDGDGLNDGDPAEECPLVPITTCRADERATGPDSDGDGVSDDRELVLGTDLHEPDTDGDGLTDGEEDINGDGYWRRHEGETDPLNPDTDGDGLTDGIERGGTIDTDPTVADTDGDCIPDGVEDANQDGHWTSNETRPDVVDTDSDGLWDGRAANGTGEDLNCNGLVDDFDGDGRPDETNPRAADSDNDGIPDYDEMFTGGQWNLNNVNRATTGRGGCTLAPTAAAGSADGLIAMMMGLMLAGIARVRMSLRSRKRR